MKNSNCSLAILDRTGRPHNCRVSCFLMIQGCYIVPFIQHRFRPYECFDGAQHERKISDDFNPCPFVLRPSKDERILLRNHKNENPRRTIMVLRHLFQVSQVVAVAFLLSCAASTPTGVANHQYATGTGPSDKLQLPAPFDTPSARNNSKVIGWPKGKMPTAATGFEVSLFAENLDNPRQAYVLPNGDILVVEATREWPGTDE